VAGAAFAEEPTATATATGGATAAIGSGAASSSTAGQLGNRGAASAADSSIAGKGDICEVDQGRTEAAIDKQSAAHAGAAAPARPSGATTGQPVGNVQITNEDNSAGDKEWPHGPVTADGQALIRGTP